MRKLNNLLIYNILIEAAISENLNDSSFTIARFVPI